MRRVVTVVSKQGCHLCEKVIDALSSLSSRYDFQVRVIDIRDNPMLHDSYWLTVPAVQVDGKDVFDARDMGPGEDYAKKLELLVSS
jgi:glutaredoxin